jgi:hypothetical protein
MSTFLDAIDVIDHAAALRPATRCTARAGSARRSSRRHRPATMRCCCSRSTASRRPTGCASPPTSARSPAPRASNGTTPIGWPTRRIATSRRRRRCPRC